MSRTAITAEMLAAIRTRVAVKPGLSLTELLAMPDVTADAVYSMIAREALYVDLKAVPLANPDRVRVFADRTTAEAYAIVGERPAAERPIVPRPVSQLRDEIVMLDGKRCQIMLVGDTTTILLPLDEKNAAPIMLQNEHFEAFVRAGHIKGLPVGADETLKEVLRLMHEAGPEGMEVANRRYHAIESELNGGAPAMNGVSARTKRRYKRLYRDAERRYGNGYIGLLPRGKERGNRTPRLVDRVVELMETFIATVYETVTQPSKKLVYGQFAEACAKDGLPVPAYKTFTSHIQKRDEREQVEKREGRRAAYALTGPVRGAGGGTPPHGDRPCERAHIDHTLLDIQLVSSRTGKVLGRPWFTAMIDASTRRILAIWLDFNPPSYRACMMVALECVRRFNRLPDCLVVDGGKEFQSTYWETLMAFTRVRLEIRPAAKPRFGSVLERFIETLLKDLIHNLAGNTKASKKPRQMTKEVDPRRHADWTLEELHGTMCRWAYDEYDTIEHSALGGQSPREAYEQGIRTSGTRPRRLIPYDDVLRIIALPSTDKGTTKVHPQGIKVHGIWYWHNALRRLLGQSVPVRYDPYDISVTYVYVEGRWIRCTSSYVETLAGHTERELMLASAILRQQHRGSGRRFETTSRRLAQFLRSEEAAKRLRHQRECDAATKPIIAVVRGESPLTSDEPAMTADGTTPSNGSAPQGPVANITPRIFRDLKHVE